MSNEFVAPLIGGALIGLAVTLMLLFNGRVTGISGILAGSLSRPTNDFGWRLAFFGGLLSGALVARVMNPDFFLNLSTRGIGSIAVAGLLVGYGTVMGGGCTSGHGVCGMSRLSFRSIVATVTFILFGLLAVAAFNYMTGGAT